MHVGQRALGRRHRAAEPRIDPRRRVARARERLEDALDRCGARSRRSAAARAGCTAARVANAAKNSLASSQSKSPIHLPSRPATFHTNAGRPQKSTAHGHQRLVHRQRRRAVAHDAGAVAERLLERAAEHQPDVLDGVVGVDLDVAARRDRRGRTAPWRANASSMCEGTAPASRSRARRVRRARARRRICVSLVLRSIDAVRATSPCIRWVCDRTNIAWLRHPAG